MENTKYEFRIYMFKKLPSPPSRGLLRPSALREKGSLVRLAGFEPATYGFVDLF